MTVEEARAYIKEMQPVRDSDTIVITLERMRKLAKSLLIISEHLEKKDGH